MTLQMIHSGQGQRTYDSYKWNGSLNLTYTTAPSGHSGSWMTTGQYTRWENSAYSGDTLVVGFRVELPSSNPGNAVALCQIGERTSPGNALQSHVLFRASATGFVEIRRTNGSGTLLATSASALPFGSGVRYFEFKVKVHDSTGTAEMKIDEVSFVSVTGADTKDNGNSSAGKANTFQPLVGEFIDSFPSWKFRDVYVCTTEGSVNNDYLGVFRAGVKTVSGAGNSAQFTANGAATPRECVDDGTTVDNDTTYASSATAGQKDTHALTSSGLTSGAVIRGTQTNVIMRKDDADPRSGCTIIRSGGADFDLATLSLGTSYVNNREIQETDPNTSAAWLQADLDSIELGYKVVS